MTAPTSKESFRKPLAIITGGAGGMGLACARRLANTHALILADYNQDRLDRVVDVLREEDDADIAAAICGDIADDATIEQLAQAAGAGPCRALIHTAGLSPALAGWEAIVRTNLVGTAKLIAAIEPILLRGFVGVFLSSTARCFVPPAGDALTRALSSPLAEDLIESLAPLLGDDAQSRAGNAYAYTKAWLTDLVQRRAAQWASRGARVVSISPGFIRTPMTTREVKERPEMQARLDYTPLQRWGTVTDITDLVEFLLSDKASFITGTDIIIDGGLSARVLTDA